MGAMMMNQQATRRGVLAGCAATALAGAACAAPVSYTTPGLVPPLKQPTAMSCWAAVSTMMYSWKQHGSYDINTVVALAGSHFTDAYKADTGLTVADKPGLLSKLGLKAEAPQSFTVDGWAGLLKAHGPIWVTTNEGTAENFAIHARIVTAIKGDGKADSTFFTIVDPADGTVHTESISVFVKKFEDLAHSVDVQVVHY